MKHLLSCILLSLACSPQQVGCEVPTDTGDAHEAGGATRPEPLTPRTDGTAIEHTLRFPAPHTNHVQVETVFATEGLRAVEADEAGGAGVEVMMAVWTPGSYLVREFARHVRGFEASTTEGEALLAFKVRKNRWRIVPPEGVEMPERIVIRYRVYAHEMSVRTNFVDDEFALICGASTFMAPVGALDRPHDLALELPDGWTESVTGLDPHPEGAHHYLARDFDELLDAPLALGNPTLHRFDAGGVPHTLATFGGGSAWDDEKAARDVEAIVAAQHAFWGVVPYQRYVFINLAMGGGGGLEHRTSTVMLTDRHATDDEDEYRRWLGLVSHEFFHTWNIKRLRPSTLGPFDFENENYTDALWIVEGLTSYYDDLLLRRAELLNDEQYFARIAKGVGRLQATPGRAEQSLAESSFDTWIHFYRPDENTRNSGISYYTKGALAGFLLDARIRDASGGSASLDDVMRAAYARYSGETGYTSAQFRALAEEIAEEDLGDFWRTAIEGTDELDYEAALSTYALHFAEVEESDDAYLGVVVDDGGRALVREVVRSGPAFEAGINVGDELIAFGEERLPSDWSSALRHHEAGEALDVLIARRGLLRRRRVELGVAPRSEWSVEEDPEGSPAARRARTRWLEGDGTARASAPDGETPAEEGAASIEPNEAEGAPAPEGAAGSEGTAEPASDESAEGTPAP